MRINTQLNSLLALVVLTMGMAAGPFEAAAQGMQRITLQFSVNISDSLAPIDPITGTITYIAPNLYGSIQSFESISLTIAGHSYSVGEIGYSFDPANDLVVIGGLVNGAGAISSDFTDDFWLRWHRASSTPRDFFYGTSGAAGIWPRSGPELPLRESFSVFNITAEPVPEPASASLLLLGAALGWVCLARRSCPGSFLLSRPAPLTLCVRHAKDIT